ncbi:hypothetical protein GWK08_11470 [Leptobacterium flavescens]|uniref:DUF4179 domain-containing protein n=1 Tax=Leptobacterium flavescens TaxID=472055 RepID=A0A6P0UNI1_9FLAO|nr:hypothetical protein [Leptobacterium flavescens]NER14062.1 hypothetical protein [Leptobacterium flavescens]
MKKDHLEKLFNQLEGEFDLENPQEGHQDRFLQKLMANDNTSTPVTSQRKQRNWWKPLSIAATFLLLVSVGIGINKYNTENEVVVSPEIQETQFYFASLLEQEVEKVNAATTAETKVIIDDAMVQLKKLEKDYEKLENALLENGDSKQLLYAMITNFQTRINLLKEVLIQIEEIKEQKDQQNESTII